MMRRKIQTGMRVLAGLAVAIAAMAPAVADAQIVRVTREDTRNAIGFNFGYFAVRGEDSRIDDDVLVADLDSLAFEIGDFSGATFGGEWVYGVSDYLETGVGLGYYRRTVPSVYRFLENEETGGDIAQDLRLRVIPITGTVRFLPVGRGGAVEPYVGAGIGIFNWRYSEIGEFVDLNDDIFEGRFIANGTAVGPVILAGLRFPVGDVWSAGGEIRWQRAEGDTSEEDGLLAPKIDLGGWTTSFTMHFRF